VFPVGDFLRRRTTPYVNWALIAINVGVFVYTLSLNTQPDETLGQFRVSEADRFYYDWGGLPACLAEYFGIDSGAGPRALDTFCPEGARPVLQVFTGMFLHAGWGHIAANMLFLWIFGDNIEDRLGHVRYVFFYLASGVAAMTAQTALSLDTTVPTVGASGAIAGVMGAYVILHPTAMVQVIIFPLFFLPFFLPAALLIGIWFAMQLLGGISELGETAGSSIAWWAHIGGFVTGVVLVILVGRRRRAGPRLIQSS
jgi:membrane associated rhomboid family serine protease